MRKASYDLYLKMWDKKSEPVNGMRVRLIVYTKGGTKVGTL